MGPIRLNLFNYLLVLFCAKFACNLAIRYPVFRWDSCKGSVWENVKKSQKCAIQGSLMTGSCDWLAIGKSLEWYTCEVCRGSWRVTSAIALQEKTSSLVRQLACDSNLRLVPIVRLSRQNALFVRNLTFRICHTPYYKYPYSHEMLRASRENFERETLEKNKIDSSTIFILWFSKFLYSHPFHWYILERYI